MGSRGSASKIATRAAKYLTQKGRPAASKQVDIQKIKDKTLQGIEDRVRHLKHEEAFLFDSSDKLMDGRSGGKSSVGIPSLWDQVPGATVTHGHPVGNYNFGGTLSMADADRMAQTEWSEMRAAAAGQGEYNYIMRRTAKADNEGLRRQIGRDADRMEKSIKTEFQKAFKNAIARGQTRESALHEAAQKATGLMDAYWKQVLPQYGFEYVTRKRGYRYGR